MNLKVKEIAEALGFELGYTQYDHGGFIKIKPKGEMFIRISDGKGTVSGIYCKDMNGNTHQPNYSPVIGFGATRDSKSIAVDIERRFLSDYLKSYDESEKAARNWDAHYIKVGGIMDKICRETGFDKPTNKETLDVSGFLNDRYVRIRVNSDNVDLSIKGLSLNEFFKIIEVVK